MKQNTCLIFVQLSHILYHEKVLNTTSNEWVVLIHGAGGSIQTWNYQREELSKYFNLLLIDLRDHGNSKEINPDSNSYDFDLISRDIIETLRYNQIQRAHFISLSFGSVLIQSLLMRAPEMVEKSILAGTVLSGSSRLKLFVHSARFFNLFLPFEKMYSIFSKLLMPYPYQKLSRRIYVMQARKLSEKAYLKWLGLYSSFYFLLNKFLSQNIQKEALLIMGQNDYMFLPAAKRFAEKRDNVELSIIQNAGHICNIDQPQTFNERVIKFLVS